MHPFQRCLFKRAGSLVLLLTALFGIGACSSGDRRPVSFAELAAYQSLVDAFADYELDIDVELIHIPDQSDYRRRLSTDFAAGTPADIVLLNYRRYAAYAARGVLEPLGPYLDTSEALSESDFYVEAITPFYWSGRLMCIPQNLSSLVVYYNRDLFRQSGVTEPSADWTWDDLLAAALALTHDTNGDGQAEQYGFGTTVSLQRVAPFIWQNGGELVYPPDNPRGLALDSPPAREAVQWFVDL
jgi:multiple sugar transport system substrate-binding protein